MVQPIVNTTAAGTLLATFFIRGGHCGVDAAGVQEVIRLGPLTPFRHAPEEVLGIVNLRGRIVTILDVGLKLGFAGIVIRPENRIFIVEDRGEFIGLLVDRVGEVVEMEDGRVEPPPANVPYSRSRFFRGVYRTERQVITLVDVSQVLAEGTQ